MGTLRVTFQAAAVAPDCCPSLPRSGAFAAPLPAWHPHEVIMLGGYTEDRGGRAGARTAAPAVSKDPAPQPTTTVPRRNPTIEAWTFSSQGGGRWHRVDYAEDNPVPQPRLTCQAALVGDELWLVGGWDPSAGPEGQPFLNDVWALDLRTYRWRRVEVAGEEMPRISRFAMAPLPDGRLLLHTHRCDDHVLLMDPRVTSHESSAAGAGEAADTARATASEQPVLRKVAVQGTNPGARSPPSRGLHSLTLAAAPPAAPPMAAGTATTDGSGSAALYVYGGAPQSGAMYGDLWALDTATMTWRQLDPVGAEPQARCSHVAAACAAGRYLLVAGGSYYVQPGQLKPLDDIIVYDTQTDGWLQGPEQVQVEGPRPSPRNAAIMAPLRRSDDGTGAAEGDRFVLHGGWRPFVETYDDTYIVTVTSAAAATTAEGRQ